MSDRSLNPCDTAAMPRDELFRTPRAVDSMNVVLTQRALTPQEVAFLANRGNVNVPDYVVRFAPELRFTQDSASQGYPMSAQPFFDRLTKDSNGHVIGSTPIAMFAPAFRAASSRCLPGCSSGGQAISSRKSSCAEASIQDDSTLL